MGLHFEPDGVVHLHRPWKLRTTGKYVVAGRKVTLDWGQDEKESAEFAQDDDKLTLQLFDKTGARTEKRELKKVVQYDEPINHPNGRPSDGKEKLLVGGWDGKTVGEPFKYYEYSFEFFDDGSFVCLATDHFRPSYRTGTYRPLPNTDNCIELTYPDTARQRPTFVHVEKNKLLLRRFSFFGDDVELTRRKQPRPTWRPKGLTASALQAEFRADEEAARKKYAGQTIELVGVVGSHRTSDDKAEVHLITGEMQLVVCEFADAKKTAEKLPGLILKTLQVRLEGRFARSSREIPWTIKQLEGLLGGKAQLNEKPLVVFLDQCVVVGVDKLES